ncbi:GFA family protein [Sedimenticola sp.]|uniref:GFA family protein n=1 Tax=Sedimenticola sp. TaxID=1940285 RepID=UPI003D102266
MSNPIQPPLRGQCLCGGVKYQVDAIEPRMAHCHCSMCRKFHGAAFATFGEAKSASFHWLEGEDLLKSYRAENGTVRRFCANCGSSLTFAPPKDTGEYVEFTLGTLVDDPKLTPDAHIFVGSKAGWDHICDQLPQYEAGRGSQQLD